MARPIVTPFQVADLNAELAQAGLAGRVRLVDACGGQSLELQMEDDGQREEAAASVRAFFERLRMDARFDAAERWFTLA